MSEDAARDVPFVQSVAPYGMYNSLSQTLLKLTCPGVPNLYQGTELWDFSLVDPDNRRPVDYGLRLRILEEMEQTLGKSADRTGLCGALIESMEDGKVKFYLTRTVLGFRRDRRLLFEQGDYVPLEATGPCHEHVCAFSRSHDQETMIVLAPRWFLRLTGGKGPPLGEPVWKDTGIRFPEALSGVYINVLTGERTEVLPGPASDAVPVSRVLKTFPVALLHRLP